jgi:hypothetical protein
MYQPVSKGHRVECAMAHFLLQLQRSIKVLSADFMWRQIEQYRQSGKEQPIAIFATFHIQKAALKIRSS